MRRVKAKERKAAGNIYCSHCHPAKVNAVWRKYYHASPKTDFACEEHKHLINKSSDEPDHMTEADYQTWDRL